MLENSLMFGTESSLGWLAGKTFFLLLVLTLIKGALPNWRTDKIVNIGFKVCLPFALAWLTLSAGFLYFAQAEG